MELIKKQSYFLIFFILTYAFNLFFNAYLTEHLYPEDYGQVALIIRIFIFCFPFTLLGANYALLKFGPVYLESKEYQLFYGFSRWSLKIFLFSCVILFALTIILLIIVFIFKEIDFHAWDYYFPFIWIAVLAPLFGYMVYQNTYFRVFHKQTLFISSSIIYPLIALLLVIFFEFLFDIIDENHVALSLFLALSIIIFYQHFIVKAYSPPKPQALLQPSNETYLTWRKTSFNLMTHSLLVLGIVSIDLVLLQLLDNSIGVAKFNVLITICDIFPLIESTSNALINPLISPIALRNDYAGLQHLYNWTIFFKTGMGLIILIIFIVFGKLILGLFSVFYVTSYPELVFLGVVFLFYLWLGSSATFLKYSNHSHVIVPITAIELIVVIIAEVILIPLYQVWGAIFGMTIGTLVGGILTMLCLKHYLKLKLFVYF